MYSEKAILRTTSLNYEGVYICDMLIFYIYLTDKYKNNPYFAISIF